MDWRDILKETVGITEEGSIVDLNDMEEREILGEGCLSYLSHTQENRVLESVSIACDSHV